ncbi:hypothetical protein [Arthrobacter sp. PsM3]|uniref:hypothetical protein n=1 Tax=Arthrobacter sp. PsM3 TaxID=3030531 RepID=UPI00263B6085|nr:hypothetical protein [Arthrobacter sp. PsM3]MDN4646202.1 hypothetical protein [Arthrobacter sp. PsM3]
MSEPEPDLFARPAEPKRIPLWKLEEMVGGAAGTEGWRGNASPLLPGWETGPIHTSSAIRDVQPRRAPWPLRILRAIGRMLALLLKTAGVLAGVAYLAGVGMYLHGDLKPSTFLGCPAVNPAPPFTIPNPVLPPGRASPAGPHPMPSPTFPPRAAKSSRSRSAGPLRRLCLPARRR